MDTGSWPKRAALSVVLVRVAALAAAEDTLFASLYRLAGVLVEALARQCGCHAGRDRIRLQIRRRV